MFSKPWMEHSEPNIFSQLQKKFWSILKRWLFVCRPDKNTSVEIVFSMVLLSNSRFGHRKKRPSYDTLKQRPNILRWKRWFWTKQWLWGDSDHPWCSWHTTHTSSSHKWSFKKKQKSLSSICWNMYIHRIHAQYIYLSQWLIFEVNVGKHTIVLWIRHGIWYRPSNKTQVVKLPHPNPNFNKVRYGETLHACQKLDFPTLKSLRRLTRRLFWPSGDMKLFLLFSDHKRHHMYLYLSSIWWFKPHLIKKHIIQKW